jgi:hypothetical protein
MKRYKYPPSGVQVWDVDHDLWDVREARATKHGFDLLFGSPASTPLGSAITGLPRLISTPALRDYWEQNRTKRHGEVFDLPAGRTTLKRARKRLGFNVVDDTEAFFRRRKGDLKKLSARKFAEKHEVDFHVAMAWRLRLVGRKARPLGWWRDESVLAILRQPITHREAGEQLGIKTSHVHRLRVRMQAEFGSGETELLLAA